VRPPPCVRKGVGVGVGVGVGAYGASMHNGKYLILSRVSGTNSSLLYCPTLLLI
jgi:hypothetical protein